jgi:hypothetical protein
MTKEEEIGSEEDNSSRVTMLENFDFEDVWSFKHPHMNVKESREKLCEVEVPIEKRTFRIFQKEERDDYDYALESNLLRVWEYTKAKCKEKIVPYNFQKQEQLQKEVIFLGLDYLFVGIYKKPWESPYKTYIAIFWN